MFTPFTPQIIPVPGNNPKKVERITPSAQSEIDKKSYRALDHDFVTTEKTERTPEKKRRVGDKVRCLNIFGYYCTMGNYEVAGIHSFRSENIHFCGGVVSLCQGWERS